METLVHPIRILKHRLGPLWWYSSLMFAASRVGDVVGLYIGMFLVPAVLAPEKLGAVLPLVKFGVLVAAPLGVVARTAMKFISMLLVKGEHGKIKAILRDLAVLSCGVSLLIILTMWLGWGFVERRLKIEDDRILWLLAATVILTCWSPLAHSVSQGLKHFYRIILARLLGPIGRLVVAVLLLHQLQIVGYLLANLAVMVITLLLLGDGLTRYFRREIPSVNYRSLLPEMLRYAVPIGLMTLMISLQLTVEPWVVRHRLPALDSAGFYVAAMFGNIPLWVAPAMTPFLFPLVSERFERGESTRKLHLQAVLFAGLIGAAIAAVLLLFGDRLLSLRAAWDQYRGYSPFMWKIACVTTLDVLFNCHMIHESACRRFGFLRYLLPLILGEVALLYVLMGWGALEGVLAPGLWQWVNGAYTPSLGFVINFMLATRLIMAIGVVLDLVRSRPTKPSCVSA